MSWIKENKFIAALGGGTLLGVAGLVALGLYGSGQYTDAKAGFDTSMDEASNFEKLELYPTEENQQAKEKALATYKQSVEAIQLSFEPFRPKEIKDISPQDFTSKVLAANTEVKKAFDTAGTSVPDAFFLGFERYRTSLAPSNTTGILDYQLSAIKSLMLSLAKANPSEVRNLYRPNLPEEDGQKFTAGDKSVARTFPLEITFVAPEKSVRSFLTALSKAENQFFVIRSLRITNEKKEAPKSTDAKFEVPADAAAPETAPAQDFTAPDATAEVPNSSRILSQVLGSEKIQVFLRLDLLEFLPAKKLP